MDAIPVIGSIIGALLIGAYVFRRVRVAGVRCDCSDRLDGRVALVTGASSGIGREVARQLALRGARVYLLCRSLASGKEAARAIIDETANTAVFALLVDLNCLASIRRLVQEFKQVESRLDILVNNAGCFFCPPSLTEDGFTVTFQTNFLGHFLLTRLLAPLVAAAASGRVVFVSSAAHLAPSRLQFDCAGRTQTGDAAAAPLPVPADSRRALQYHVTAYSQAKLALAVFAAELAHRLRAKHISVNSVDPGNVNTDIYRHYKEINTPYNRLLRLYFQRSVLEGAQGVIHCAVSSKIEGITGQYFKDCVICDANPLVRDRRLGDDLWRLSERWTGLTSL